MRPTSLASSHTVSTVWEFISALYSFCGYSPDFPPNIVSPYSSGHLISASSFFLYFAIIISPSQIVPQVIKLHEIIPTFIRSIKISVGIFVFKQELRRNVLSYISFLLSAPGVVTITFSGVIITSPFAIAAPLNIFSTIALKVLTISPSATYSAVHFI